MVQTYENEVDEFFAWSVGFGHFGRLPTTQCVS